MAVPVLLIEDKVCCKIHALLEIKGSSLLCYVKQSRKGASMSKIALVYSPFVWELSMPPLGIASLSAYMKMYGYEVDLFDYNYELLTSTFEKNIEGKLRNAITSIKQEPSFYQLGVIEEYSFYMSRNIEHLKNIFSENYPYNEVTDHFFSSRVQELAKYDIVGFSVMFKEQIKFSAQLATLLKKQKPEIKIVIGGTSVRSQDFSGCHDYIIYGDGEIKFLEYVNNLAKPQNNPANASVKTLVTEADLNLFPPPDFSELFKKYQYLSPHNIIPCAVTRGCYWRKCLFCAQGWSDTKSNKATARYRKAGINKILADILYLKEMYKTKYFYFTVDVSDPALLKELSKHLMDRSIDIYWRTEIRAEKIFLKTDILSNMYQAGCRAISFGFEAVTQDVLNAMKKGIKAEDSMALIDLLYDLGIGINIDYFIGFPSEKPKEAALTHQFLINQNHKILPYMISHFYSYYENSPIAKLVKESSYNFLRYDNNNRLIKSGMSFEGQKRQSQIGAANMLFNPNMLRFPIRNDGAIFFLYCARYSVKEIAQMIKSNPSFLKIFQQSIDAFSLTSFYVKNFKLDIDYESFFLSLNEKFMRIKNPSNVKILLVHYFCLKEFIKFLPLAISEKNFLFECAKIDFYLLLTTINPTNRVPYIDEQEINLEKLSEIKTLKTDGSSKIYIRRFNYDLQKIVNWLDFNEIESNFNTFGIFDVNGVHITNSNLTVTLINEMIKCGKKISVEKILEDYDKSDVYESITYLLKEKIVLAI
jgi:radical SAM superfamily enzyme YgiQ (UPF0313 family)